MLLDVDAAICADSLTCDPASVIAGDKGNDIGNISGLTQSTQSRLGDHVGSSLLRHCRLKHISGSGTRCDTIDSDMSGSQVLSSDAGQCIESGFGGRVDAKPRYCYFCYSGRDIDNATAIIKVG